MITHQTPEQILQAATPEQKILWNYLFLEYGERISISQFCFFGSLTGELSVYSANKLYFAYEIDYSGFSGSQNISSNLVLYSPANVAYFYMSGEKPYWDATAAGLRYIVNETQRKNWLFSRLATNNINFIKFVGYRIGI